MGAHHNGFCDPLATDTARTGCGMGDSGPAHEVGTFSSCADDLHIGEILPVVYLRDLRRTFGRASKRLWVHEYSFPPTDKWSVREDHTGVRGHAMSMRPGS